MKVPNQIAQVADNMSKNTRLPFRDCLDILMRAYLQEIAERQPLARESGQRRIVRTQPRQQGIRVAVSCS